MKYVLIIDDNKKMQEVWQKAVVRYGLSEELHIIPAYTLTEAATAFEHFGGIDLVALDGSIERPDDGRQFIPELKRRYHGPIIAISASEGMSELMHTEGCHHFCEKKYAFKNIANILGITL